MLPRRASRHDTSVSHQRCREKCQQHWKVDHHLQQVLDELSAEYHRKRLAGDEAERHGKIGVQEQVDDHDVDHSCDHGTDAERNRFVLLENAEGAASLAYTVTVGNSVEAIKSGDTIAVFNTDADLTKIQSSNPLDFSANKPVFAGNYSDTVTFTIRVGNI